MFVQLKPEMFDTAAVKMTEIYFVLFKNRI